MQSKTLNKKLPKIIEHIKNLSNPENNPQNLQIEGEITNLFKELTAIEENFDVHGFIEQRIKLTQQQLEEASKQEENAEIIKYIKTALICDQLFLKQDFLIHTIMNMGNDLFQNLNTVLQMESEDSRFTELENRFDEATIDEALAIAEAQGIDIEEALKTILATKGAKQNDIDNPLPNTQTPPSNKNSLQRIKEQYRNRSN